MPPRSRFLSSKTIGNAFLILIILALLSFPVFGRERGPDEGLLKRFDVVTPLNGMVVTGNVVFMVKPSENSDKVTLRMVSPSSDWSETLDPSSNFTAGFDSTGFEDGEYEFELESCSLTECDTQRISVTLNNNLSTLIRPLPTRGDGSRPTFSVLPSNVFGIFSMKNPREDPVYHSGGDPFIIPEGKYDLSALLVNAGNLDLSLSGVEINSNDLLIEVTPPSDEVYSFQSDGWDVIQRYHLVFGHPYASGTISIPARDGESVAYCADWVSRSKSCDGEWIFPPRDSLSVPTTHARVVVAYVRRQSLPDDALPPRSPDGEIIIPSPDENIEYVSLTPSSIPSILTLFDSSGVHYTTSSSTILVPKGVYHAELD
ncbi:MAG: hypothetical protein AABX02_02910, partial [archaeon]